MHPGWPRVEAVLNQVLDLEIDPSQSLSDDELETVRHLCDADAELEREVLELLSAMAVAGDSIDLPVSQALPSLMADFARPDEDAAADGRTIDRYRLLDIVGRGGMGVVYRAERIDSSIEKQVALKVIPRGLEGGEREARFERERQILARLEHPGIARFLDGGRTDEGYPFLVMELVDGTPIDLYCEQNQLGLRSRIELFLQVCSAVAYAHRQLIVHRDIKASNCLVDADGRVRLIDFGIAKILAEDADEETVLQPMTPNTASPEQLENEPVSTATDVYSLGLLLYRLLAGAGPFDLGTDSSPGRLSSSDLRRLVREQDPPPVSDRLLELSRPDPPPEVRRLARELRPDLDTVVLEALQRDPEDRYPSVAELAADLGRHLEGFPIQARPISNWARIRKFAARHRAAVASGLVAALLAMVGLTIVLWQADLVRRERDHARLEAERATRLARFVTGVLEAGSIDTSERGERTARELVLDAEERVDRELGTTPVVQASMLDVLAMCYLSFAEYEKAIELATRAAGLLEHSQGTDELARARVHTTLASAKRSHGDLEGLDSLLLEALAVYEKYDQLDSLDAAKTLRELGRLLAGTGREEESIERHRQTLQILEQHGERRAAAMERATLASRLTRVGRSEESLDLYREALAVLEQEDGAISLQVAATRNNLANLLLNRGQLEEAEIAYRKALEIGEELLGEGHPRTASAMSNLARILMERRDFEAAEPFARRAHDILVSSRHPDNSNRLGAQMNLARVELEVGDIDRSIDLYRDGLASWIRLRGDDSAAAARTRSLLAEALTRAGALKEAEALFLQAIDQQERNQASPRNRAETQLGLARLYALEGRCEQSRELVARAEEVSGFQIWGSEIRGSELWAAEEGTLCSDTESSAS